MNEKDFHDHHYGTDSNRIRNGALFRRAYDRSVRDFLDRTGIGRTHRVLSLGCGDGSAELRLAPHVGEIVGVDISPVAIEQARAAAKAAGLSNLTFLSSDASSLRLDQFGEFDCVAAFAFLHHLPDAGVATVLEEARKVLRPGGVFYSSDPSSRRFIRLLAGLVRSTYDQHHSPDERELDPEGLIALATKAGFLAPSVGYHDYFFGPVAWLAPGAPRWLVGPLSALDDLALAVPGVRRYASSFSLVARAA
jgi:SAM-dependent methyltransferase